MGGRRQKKMSLKRKQANHLASPSITLEKLVEITQSYLEDLNSNERTPLIPLCGKTMRFRR